MAQSTISWQAGWGLHWLSLDQPGSIAPEKIAAITARLMARNAAGRVDLDENRWRPWTDAEWHRWAKAYTAAN